MKVAVIGAGGVRTPLFVRRLVESAADLGITTLSLMDVNAGALDLIAYICRFLVDVAGNSVRLEVTTNPDEGIDGADYVMTTLRVGGIEGRVIDEQVPLRYGIIGQETTGPGGFAMALRTIPVMLDYTRVILKRAPGAWVINFTNPSGLVTQALTSETPIKIVGVCDTPDSLIRRVASALDISSEDAAWGYAGLNHLAWLTSVDRCGEDLLPSLIARASKDPQDPAVRKVKEIKLLGLPLIASLGMIPNQYLYYYYFPQESVSNIKSSGETRGQSIRKLNTLLYARLAEAKRKNDIEMALKAHAEILRQRSDTYMQAETGRAIHSQSTSPTHEADLHPESQGGYEAAAIGVIRSIVKNSGSTHILNAPSAGTFEGLEKTDVAEVPCTVDARGPRPAGGSVLPDVALGLTQHVKAYERLTCQAAITGSYATALKALVCHPLVGSFGLAEKILNDYICEHGESLAYLRSSRQQTA